MNFPKKLTAFRTRIMPFLLMGMTKINFVIYLLRRTLTCQRYSHQQLQSKLDGTYFRNMFVGDPTSASDKAKIMYISEGQPSPYKSML